MRKTEDVRMRPMWLESHVFADPSAPVQIVRSSRQSITRRHQHEFTELVFITGGKGIHLVNASSYELEAGFCFVIEAGGMHAYQNTHELELINVLIRHDAMERLRRVVRKLDGYPKLVASPPVGRGEQLHTSAVVEPRPPEDPWGQPRPLTPHEMADCLRVIEEIEAESARGADGWRDMQETLTQELFIIACRATAAPANNESGIRARIQAVIRHMERNYADPVTTAHLEKIANMSERTLQRHFRTATGVSPLHYLLRVRIAHASRMIGETDLPMTDIGGRCGIPNSAYFSRLFQQFTGISPSAWRKRSRQGQRQG